MWKSACCLWITFVLGLTAVILDIVIVQKAVTQEPTEDIKIEVGYGWQELTYIVKYPDDDGSNITDTVTYSDAYRTVCKKAGNQNETMCEDLEDLETGGGAYLTLDLCFVVITLFGFLIALPLSLARCLFGKRCPFRTRFIIAGHAFLSFMLVSAALITYTATWSTDLSGIIEVILLQYPGFTVNTEYDWRDGQMGNSLILLLTCTVSTMSTVLVALIWDRHWDNGPYEKDQYIYHTLFPSKQERMYGRIGTKQRRKKRVILRMHRNEDDFIEVDKEVMDIPEEELVQRYDEDEELKSDYEYNTEMTGLIRANPVVSNVDDEESADNSSALPTDANTAMVFEHPVFSMLSFNVGGQRYIYESETDASELGNEQYYTL